MLASSAAPSSRDLERRAKGRSPMMTPERRLSIERSSSSCSSRVSILRLREGLEADALPFVDNGEKDVLRQHLIGPASLGFLLGENGQDALGAMGQTLEHQAPSSTLYSARAIASFTSRALLISSDEVEGKSRSPDAMATDPGPKALSRVPIARVSAPTRDFLRAARRKRTE